jgi:hypothetical protein
VQIEYDVVHLRTSLVQLFVLLQLNFEEVAQIIELKRFRDAPNGYPFAALLEIESPATARPTARRSSGVSRCCHHDRS